MGLNMDRTFAIAGILRNIIFFILLEVLTTACRNPVQPVLPGSPADILANPDPNPVQFDYQQDPPVLPIDFGNYSQKTVTIQNAPGRQVFLVKANSSTNLIPGTATGEAWSRTLTMDPGSYPGSHPGRREHEAALRFNANPPPIPFGAQARSLASPITYGSTPSDYIEGTTKKYFWVEQGDTWIYLSATLRAIGEYSYIWVADDNFNASSTNDRDNKLTTEQAWLIRDKFDGTTGSEYRDGIFRNVSTIFGHEYGGGYNSDDVGGRDGDQHISILLYDIDFDYPEAIPETQTGGVFGYFWSKDFYPQDQLGNNLKTNNAEIFYLDAHFADSYPRDIYSTMAHEYQHMIHFNMKYLRLGGLRSDTWFNELCSMVAEDLVLENIGLDPLVDGPQSRLDVFAYHYAESGVSDWLDDDEVLKSYAGAFAFGAYLARNFGGASFFHELLHNDKVNEAAISTAMAALSVDGASDNGMGFSQELLRYGEALVLTENPAPGGLRSLNREVTSFIADDATGDDTAEDSPAEDGISYTIHAIDLDSLRQYNLVTGKLVSNEYGLRTYHPLDAPSLRPYGNSIHTQDSWTNIAGDLSISLEAPGDSAVRYFLVVR